MNLRCHNNRIIMSVLARLLLTLRSRGPFGDEKVDVLKRENTEYEETQMFTGGTVERN